jgi:hypothetical protein
MTGPWKRCPGRAAHRLLQALRCAVWLLSVLTGNLSEDLFRPQYDNTSVVPRNQFEHPTADQPRRRAAGDRDAPRQWMGMSFTTQLLRLSDWSRVMNPSTPECLTPSADYLEIATGLGPALAVPWRLLPRAWVVAPVFRRCQTQEATRGPFLAALLCRWDSPRPCILTRPWTPLEPCQGATDRDPDRDL